jgi:hypothetical protein
LSRDVVYRVCWDCQAYDSRHACPPKGVAATFDRPPLRAILRATHRMIDLHPGGPI